MLISALTCQIISNVPAAILLSAVSRRMPAAFWVGVNVGGAGTLVASGQPHHFPGIHPPQFPAAQSAFILFFRRQLRFSGSSSGSHVPFWAEQPGPARAENKTGMLDSYRK